MPRSQNLYALISCSLTYVYIWHSVSRVALVTCITCCCPSLPGASFIDGVVSVLEILHVTILSVGRECRRPECQNANTCTHLSTFQPDVVGVFRDASFVIKCVLCHHDGDVTGDHVTTLNNVQTGLGLPLGLLMYDHMEGDPQLLSQQMPTGCSLVCVGAFTWDSDWVESTLIALCKAFKTPLAMDTHPPAHPVQYTDVSVDKNRPVPNASLEKTNYSEISAIGEKAVSVCSIHINFVNIRYPTGVHYCRLSLLRTNLLLFHRRRKLIQWVCTNCMLAMHVCMHMCVTSAWLHVLYCICQTSLICTVLYTTL